MSNNKKKTDIEFDVATFSKLGYVLDATTPLQMDNIQQAILAVIGKPKSEARIIFKSLFEMDLYRPAIIAGLKKIRIYDEKYSTPRQLELKNGSCVILRLADPEAAAH